MPTDKDLFAEEESMVSMSFGDHIEDLRRHLILALLGLFVGIALTLIPGLNLGMRVMRMMQDPAQKALNDFYDDLAKKRAADATSTHAKTQNLTTYVAADDLIRELKGLAPKVAWPRPESVKGKVLPLRMSLNKADLIQTLHVNTERKSALISLAPLESATIFFMVCIAAGLVISSPWVFYQLWAFVAAGLYRHERHYVQKFLPFSLGLFLAGVFLCFFGVLPITLQFLLQFNVWLGIEPTLQISEWMSFATILPLVFGLTFQTPLIMLFLSRIGIFTADDYRGKRKFAILIMVILAAVLTPGPDVASQMMLAIPMIALYELGIILVDRKKEPAEALAD